VRLVRFRVGRGEPRSGVLDDPGADAAKPAVITALAAHALPDLLGLPLGRIREICQNPGGQAVPAEGAVLLAPVSGRTEVWAAGVTYQRSRTARMAESEHSADIYDRVYAAERPELFFKSAAWRVCGPGAPVSVRADSSIDVPEPELAVVLNYAGEVAGYTICNDVSSRSIEGQNPLYLPQAKVYLGGCAVGPWIRPAWEVPDPYALTIEMTITRGNAVAWQGTSSTSGLRRRIDELAAYLFREDDFPCGVVLSTGTSLVPDLPFTLQPGDEIRIKISEIGELVNRVVRGKAAVAAAVHADASDTLGECRLAGFRQAHVFGQPRPAVTPTTTSPRRSRPGCGG
jgi:2-dehydro-3-deoxy-D-arabinonate dehydratase